MGRPPSLNLTGCCTNIRRSSYLEGVKAVVSIRRPQRTPPEPRHLLRIQRDAIPFRIVAVAVVMPFLVCFSLLSLRGTVPVVVARRLISRCSCSLVPARVTAATGVRSCCFCGQRSSSVAVTVVVLLHLHLATPCRTPPFPQRVLCLSGACLGITIIFGVKLASQKMRCFPHHRHHHLLLPRSAKAACLAAPCTSSSFHRQSAGTRRVLPQDPPCPDPGR
jgi:hypothetical protein